MRKLLLGTICLTGILVGCTDQGKVDQVNTNQANEISKLKEQIEQISLEKDALLKIIEEERKAFELATNQQVSNAYSMIHAKAIEKYPQTLYKKVALDLDRDGEEEVVELYVNAGKTENGLFAWDDGQTWMLVVKDGEETYPLFDDYVQLGSVDFSTTIFDGKPGIVMVMSQHANKTVQKFTYDKNEKGYQKETFYKKENTQDQYNQPASYAFFKDAYELMHTAFTTKTLSVLEADEKTLQDTEKRRAIIYPIIEDLYDAWGLLGTVADLNRDLTISLEVAIDLLNQMDSKPPTTEQMNQLKIIHDVFNEIEADNVIDEKENKIHSEIMERLKKLNFIP
ncbi:hypothetical protein QTL97_14995 [Sporosarcina thermotolerans]|uniref:Lipoprotein n=1 Tax=Sporosarcina thermotolerans TaxID=633404 RepID=A0AAW9ACD3_9BACL|nr:hypothetical protein [Sporosarcina thermotolerans]MDW0118238.1 hypothetical protein [Sporosarcina thermotolerans]WHT48551.1 hypothetical protein QNH10_01555 [Sporosarcina thermotolerans]